MGITRTKKQSKQVIPLITNKRLQLLILDFLTEHEADMKSDYKPDSELWRQALAAALSEYIIHSLYKL